MKKIIVFLCIIAFVTAGFTSCQNKNKYTPAGEFYLKTAPSNGDAGASDVISIEAEFKTYQGEDDITVPMLVGFGHLPNVGGYGENVQDTFYVLYQVFEYPWSVDNKPVWEKRVDYFDSWYDDKYNSTVQKNPPSLIFARYGEFYPLYKETVDFVFPKDVSRGYADVRICVVNGGEIIDGLYGFRFEFERVGNVLTLKS